MYNYEQYTHQLISIIATTAARLLENHTKSPVSNTTPGDVITTQCTTAFVSRIYPCIKTFCKRPFSKQQKFSFAMTDKERSKICLPAHRPGSGRSHICEGGAHGYPPDTPRYTKLAKRMNNPSARIPQNHSERAQIHFRLFENFNKSHRNGTRADTCALETRFAFLHCEGGGGCRV